MSLLCERDDFTDLLILAGAELRIRPAIVEKDYYVTAALRIIAEQFPNLTLFKGGTSLSKGWKLIERFSEDIDLYVKEDRTTSRSTDRRLRRIADAVGECPHLERDSGRKSVSGKLSRTEYYTYQSQTALYPGLESVVMLEAGIQSADYPIEERPIQSLLAELLDARAVFSGANDQAAFPMKLLHFRRTFVEKLYTIHDRVERLVKIKRIPLGSYARHYYDLYQLLQTEEVIKMLPTSEYASIAVDYRRLAMRFYPQQVLPPNMDLSQSSALFPEADIHRQLEADYEDQCRRLCYGSFPNFEEVLGGFEAIRQNLIGASVAV